MRKPVLVVGMLLVAVSAFAENLRVPEPTSVALMVAGLGALALKLRRK